MTLFIISQHHGSNLIKLFRLEPREYSSQSSIQGSDAVREAELVDEERLISSLVSPLWTCSIRLMGNLEA